MGTLMSVRLTSPTILFPSALPCRMGNFGESLEKPQRTFAIYTCFMVSVVFAVLVPNAVLSQEFAYFTFPLQNLYLWLK